MWGRDGILLLHTQKAGLRGETLLSPILQIALITWYLVLGSCIEKPNARCSSNTSLYWSKQRAACCRPTLRWEQNLTLLAAAAARAVLPAGG